MQSTANAAGEGAPSVAAPASVPSAVAPASVPPVAAPASVPSVAAPASVPSAGARPSGPRLASAQLDAEALVFGGGRLRVRALVEQLEERRVSLWVRVAGHAYEISLRGCVADGEIELDAVAWWWPSGSGPQTTYRVQLLLLGPDGDLLDTSERRIGFRWTQSVVEPEQSGNPSILVVNGRPVRVRGIDWSSAGGKQQASREDYAARLGALRRANLNLVRVRDGFETEDFYELCDQLGVLVWQDLGNLGNVTGAAARQALELRDRAGLARLAAHPSVVLLQVGERTPKALHSLVAELAPQVPLLPAAAGPAGLVSLLPLPPAADLGDALDLAAEIRARRVRSGTRAGILLGRAAPRPGSALGSSGLLRQVVGQACADRLLALQPDGGGLALTLLNDDAEVFAGRATVRRLSLAGAELARHELDLVVWSYSVQTVRLPELISSPVTPGGELVVAEVGDLRTVWFFPDLQPCSLGRPGWLVTLAVAADHVRVLATPDVLVRDACLALTEAPDAEVTGGPVTLLAGETAEFTVRAPGLRPEDLAGRLLLTCRNEFGAAMTQPVAIVG